MGCGGTSYDGGAVDSVLLFQGASKLVGPIAPGRLSPSTRWLISLSSPYPSIAGTRFHENQGRRRPRRRDSAPAFQKGDSCSPQSNIGPRHSSMKCCSRRRFSRRARRVSRLQQSYTSFADNLDWLAANAGKTVTGGANGAPLSSAASGKQSISTRRRSCVVWRRRDPPLEHDPDAAAARAVRSREQHSGRPDRAAEGRACPVPARSQGRRAARAAGQNGSERERALADR